MWGRNKNEVNPACTCQEWELHTHCESETKKYLAILKNQNYADPVGRKWTREVNIACHHQESELRTLCESEMDMN